MEKKQKKWIPPKIEKLALMKTKSGTVSSIDEGVEVLHGVRLLSGSRDTFSGQSS